MINNILAIILTAICASYGHASQPPQENWADSLAHADNATDSIRICDTIVYKAINADTVYKYASILERLSIQHGDTSGLIDAYKTKAWSYYFKGNFESALQLYQKTDEILANSNNKKEKALTYYNLANTYDIINNVDQSVKYYKKAMSLYKELKDSSHIALIYRNIAMRNVEMKEYNVADTYLRKAIIIDRAINDRSSLADDIFTLIKMKFEEDKYTITRTELDRLNASADTIRMLAYHHKSEYDVANLMHKFYYIKAVLLTKYYEFDRQQWMIDSANNYCDIALAIVKNVNSSEKIVKVQLQKAKISYISNNSQIGVDITDQLKQRYNDSLGLGTKMELYKIASQCHEGVRDFEKAYVDLCEYIKCYMQYVNKSNIQKTVEFNTNLKIDEINFTHDKEQATRDKEIKTQGNIITIFFCLGALALIVFIVLLRILKLKRSNLKLVNEQNQKLSRQQDEIIAQRNTIEEQRQASERANLIMYQSISYARHIQSAALPSEEHIQRIFPEHFVYYEPKDIVSGDFYYATQNAGLDIFVLADCTGHGVPGGFLSMLGISAIKELLKNPEIDIMPGIILDMMREYIKQALSNDEEMAEAIAKGEESFSTADGMDMSIIAYDKYNHVLRFAGAYQSLYIARDGEIIRLKGDRMPVGRHINESASFQTQLFNTRKDDMIYMTSDGIPSQIGFSGVKFMSKRLVDFFKNNYTLPCEIQKRNITNIMNDWLFGATQIDDLSLIGIRITE